MRHSWHHSENPSDTGNGALCYTRTCLRCGAVSQRIKTYCGRTDSNRPWHIVVASKWDAPCAVKALVPTERM